MTEEHFSDEINSILKDYSDIWLEHLQELEILGFGNLEPDLKFLKFILAKSPELKNVRLYFDNVPDKNEESELLRNLLCSPRASPVVKINVSFHAGEFRLL